VLREKSEKNTSERRRKNYWSGNNGLAQWKRNFVGTNHQKLGRAGTPPPPIRQCATFTWVLEEKLTYHGWRGRLHTHSWVPPSDVLSRFLPSDFDMRPLLSF
jgi:hypothetical protein